jgi:hypothetical protein
MRRVLLLLALLLSFSSCTKDELICGTITGGDIDYNTGMYYLRVDSKRIWVDLVTFESYRVGDYECFEDW